MASTDRQRWDEKYRRGEHAHREPSELITRLAPWLPPSGRALDLAGGAGRHAIWLAQHGLDVTLADVSPVALELAQERAVAAGVSLTPLVVDLETEPFPAGPWDVILSFHFLWRPLFHEFPRVLAPGGVLMLVQPTISNLQRHEKPPAPFLLADGELPELVQGLAMRHYEEGWLHEGRHEALLVANRPVLGPNSP